MKLTILHLSDVHIHNPSDPILNQAHTIASACFTQARESDACLIVVTGDIAYSGEKQQYDEADLLFNLIKEELQKEGCPLVDIITVPGNHDCSLIPEDEPRSIIIDKIITEPEKATSKSIIGVCTNPQNNYFEFQKQITGKSAKSTHKLWNEYEFVINEKILRISAINAAWMSRIPEKQGELVFPIDMFSGLLAEPCEIRFALLHHPLNWYCQKSYHPLRQALHTHADVLLSGHEHLSSSGLIKDTRDGSSIYFEAGALQSHDDNITPTFLVIYFSLLDNRVEEYRCAIEHGNLQKPEEPVLHALFDEQSHKNGNLGLTKEFQNLLSDPGGKFTHPEKDNITLDDIFIFPEVKQLDVNHEDTFISVEKILFKQSKKQKILILGEEKAGKSSILFKAFSQYHHDGFAPVYVKANKFNSSDKSFKKHIEKQTESQYLNSNYLDQLEKEKKIALVDDIDKANPRILTQLINHLEQHFDCIILTANVDFEITSLISKEASNSMINFESVELQRFNSRLRHRLIKKWCLLGTVNSKPELDEQIHKIDTLVNTVIGKSLVPSQPIYLLILIQSYLRDQQNELQNSSFAYYYQYIITKSFGESGVKREELDELFNYLSQLAWYFRKNDLKEAGLTNIKTFNRGFCDEFVTIDLHQRLELLCRAKILIKRGEYYSFTYPYIYFYFLGKFLADNLYQPEIKEIVEKYCDNLNKYQNAHAILFLTHHNNNHPWVIQRILSVLQNCFKECCAIEFNDDITKINTLVNDTTRLLITEPDIEKNQEESRKIKDDLEANNGIDTEEEPTEVEEAINISYKFNVLFRTAEILGQIIKNYYGSLGRKVKNEIIDEIFNAPLRFLGTLFESISNNPEFLVNEIEKSLEHNRSDLGLFRKEEVAKKIAFHFLGIVCTGLILRTAEFVSSKSLQEDIAKVVSDKENSNAYKLIKLATYFSQPGNLPLDEIRQFRVNTEKNLFTFKILQSLAFYHLHHFHMKETEKQKLCSYVDIEITKSHEIDFKTHKNKLLK